MADEVRLRVPVGRDAARWVTRSDCRRVLLVVHNVTSATRLLDILPLLRDDLRLQLLATCTGSSPFLAGVPELLASAGLPVLPWSQATATEVDLAISASYGGELERIKGKLAVLSHGIGYNKRLATPDTGHRTPDTGRPASAPAPAPVFGLSPEWLLHRGRPLAAATVLSHPEQLVRLRAACPEAAPSAVLAGDPCYDRILAARPHRDRFRRALGVTPDQRLIVLNSTWSTRSLFGNDPGSADDPDPLPALLPRLAAELPADEYRTAAVLHPNIWYGHGHGQVRGWLDRARRAGLTLIDPLEGWRQALIAADCVLGDHSSVTYYAAAIGTPVLLGAFPDGDLDPASPVAALGRTAPRLRAHQPLRGQLDRTMAEHLPDRYAVFTAQASSAPGRSAALLRRAFYRLIGIPEPATGPALLDRLPLPPYEPPARTAPVRVLTRLLGAAPPEIAVTRYPDPAYEPEDADADGAHTVVHEDTRDPALLSVADLVTQYAAPDDPRLGPPAAWTAEILARHPHCALAVYVTGPDRCTVRTRDGELLRLTAAPDPSDGRADLCDPAAYASALHAWTGAGKSLRETAGGLTVRTGSARHRVTVERIVTPHRDRPDRPVRPVRPARPGGP